MQQSLLDTMEQPPVDTSWRPPEPPDLTGIDEVELDTETTGLDWRGRDKLIGIAVGLPDGSCRYLPFGHRGGQQLDEGAVKRWCREQLCGKRVSGLNIRFDNHVLYAWGVDLEAQGCTLHDVGHDAALLNDHRSEFSLEAIAQDYLKVGKVKGLDVTQLARYPASAVAAYAEQDVRLVGALKWLFRPLLAEQDLLRVSALEDAVIPVVCEMERNAAPLDASKLERWVKESEQVYLKLLWEVHRETGLRVEPNRVDDLVRLYHHLSLPIVHYTSNGAPSFTDEVFGNSGHPVVKLVRRARKLASLRSKYLIPYQAALLPGGLLGYHLHQLRGDYESDTSGTVSGRFSSSDKNIQQVMAVAKQVKAFGNEDYLIRELFIAGSGLFLSADAAQIEYRVFANLAKDAQLLAAYRADPWVSYHEVVWELVKKFRADVEYKPLKNLNFAILFGAQVPKVAYMLGISIEEAAELCRVYHTAFPAVRRLLNQASNLASTRGYVRTITTGRRARFPERERLHSALNRVIQGSAADVMKQKLVELYRERKRLGLTLRLTVHDEVCGDVPDQRAAELVGEVLNRQSFPLEVPILWKVSTGANWKECA